MHLTCVRKGSPRKDTSSCTRCRQMCCFVMVHLRWAANASGRQIPFVLGIPIVPPRWERCGSKRWTKNPRLTWKNGKNAGLFEDFSWSDRNSIKSMYFVCAFLSTDARVWWFVLNVSPGIFIYLSNRVVGGCRMFGAWICLTLRGSAHEHLVLMKGWDMMGC